MFKIVASVIVLNLVVMIPARQQNDVTPTSDQTPYSDPAPVTGITEDGFDGASEWTFDNERGEGARYYHIMNFSIVAPRLFISDFVHYVDLGLVYKWKLLSHPPGAHNHRARLLGENLNFWAWVKYSFGADVEDSRILTGATGRLTRTVDGVQTIVWQESVIAVATSTDLDDDDEEPAWTYDEQWDFESNAGMDVRYFNIYVQWQVGDPDVFNAELQLKCIGDIAVTLLR